MKNQRTDKDWQKLLDEGKISEEGQKNADGKAYRLLYQALNTDPEIDIPADFAHRISTQIVPASTTSGSRVWIVAAVTLGLSLILCGALLFFLYPAFFRTLSEYSGVLGFAGLVLLAVQAADYWLIQRRQNVQFNLPSI
ncbi:MAG: hypothetical protein ACFB15_12510 [Cyclobacteriaceae bacterium]